MNDELNVDLTPTDDDIVNGVGASEEALEEVEGVIGNLGGEETLPEIETDEDLVEGDVDEEDGVEMDSYDDKDEM